MSDNLPPLPQSFTILSRLQSGTEEVVPLDMVRDYGQQCRDQALEEAALRFEQVGGMIDPRSIAAAIRALKDKP